MSFTRLWEALLPIGRDERTGGYRRYSFSEAELACRAWFRAAAAERGLNVTTDRNTNLYAWWHPPTSSIKTPPATSSTQTSSASENTVASSAPRLGPWDGAIVTGSHLDSVPDGGAFDGPLGVASGFAAIDLLRARGCVPVRPIAVGAFCEEEGARFGLACLGSRLLTGVVTPARALALRDGDGVSLAEAMTAAGYDPALVGPDDELLASIGAFVELHVEQGRALAEPLLGANAAIGIAEGIWPHGRWRFDFAGRADHAGTARLADRHDPMLPFAATVIAARRCADSLGTLATFGKVRAEPGGVNGISSSVRAWLDARAPDQAGLDRTVGDITAAAGQAAREHGVELSVTNESVTPPVGFDLALRDRVAGVLAAAGIDAPVLPTGAGHDAGVLAARVPTAMLFVRNPTGISHAPGEHADLADCEAGVTALAAVLEDLACR
jgi:N-carbamoyl-L-amino-acid hydrolase